MINLNKGQKNLFLWIGILLILLGGTLTLFQGSSPITVIILVLALILILIWKFF